MSLSQKFALDTSKQTSISQNDLGFVLTVVRDNSDGINHTILDNLVHYFQENTLCEEDEENYEDDDFKEIQVGDFTISGSQQFLDAFEKGLKK